LPTLNVLRILEDKSVGMISLVTFALSALVAPLAENPVCYQNPFHRFLATGNFLSFFNLESIVTIGAAASINAASPWF
jgi:hypothetical protein